MSGKELELRARAARGPSSCEDAGEKWGPSEDDEPQEWWPAAWYEMTEKGRAALAAMKAEGPEWYWPPEAKARLKAERAAEAVAREAAEKAASGWGGFKLRAAVFAKVVLVSALGLLVLAAVVGLLFLAFSTAPWWAVVIILLLLAVLFLR